MSDRFWVGGGASTNWNATGNTNWSATSGGANNASVPGTGDLAIFDSNSGTGNSVISASITVQGLDCTGGTGDYAGTITHNTSVTLTINTGAASSLRLSAGMTYTPASTSSLITFTHTSGTANITSNGKRFAAITINGAGGTTQLLDALLVNGVATASILTITTGVFDCNGQALTCHILSCNGTSTRSLILGSSVTIGGHTAPGQIIWTINSATGLTFTKNSANITVLAALVSAQFLTVALTYNGLTLNASSTPIILNMSNSSGTSTFSSLAIGAGHGIMFPAVTVNITNAFTLTGTASLPISLLNSNPSSTATTLSVASGACTLTWGYLQNVNASGGATFVATNTLAAGGTTGWSISPPADATVAPLTAADIRAAVGLASANLDTQLDALPTNAELATALGTADDAVLAAIAALNNLSAASVNAEVDTAIADAALATAANLATVAGYLDTEIAAILADTNELQTDWANGGRLDLILDARASQASVDDLPTNAELATAVGVAQTGDSFARLGAAGAGLTALGDTRLANLDAAVSTRSTFAGGAVASVTGAVGSVTGLTAADVGAIKAKTDNLPANPAAATDTLAANITQVNGVTVDGAGTVGDPWGPA